MLRQETLSQIIKTLKEDKHWDPRLVQLVRSQNENAELFSQLLMGFSKNLNNDQWILVSAAFITHPQKAVSLALAINSLSPAERSTENIESLTINIENAKSYAKYVKTHKTSIEQKDDFAKKYTEFEKRCRGQQIETKRTFIDEDEETFFEDLAKLNELNILDDELLSFMLPHQVDFIYQFVHFLRIICEYEKELPIRIYLAILSRSFDSAYDLLRSLQDLIRYNPSVYEKNKDIYLKKENTCQFESDIVECRKIFEQYPEVMGISRSELFFDKLEYVSEILALLRFLQDIGLLTQYSINEILLRSENAGKLLTGLQYIDDAQIFSENYPMLMTHSQHAHKLGFGLSALASTDLGLYYEKRAAIIHDPENAVITANNILVDFLIHAFPTRDELKPAFLQALGEVFIKSTSDIKNQFKPILSYKPLMQKIGGAFIDSILHHSVENVEILGTEVMLAFSGLSISHSATRKEVSSVYYDGPQREVDNEEELEKNASEFKLEKFSRCRDRFVNRFHKVFNNENKPIDRLRLMCVTLADALNQCRTSNQAFLDTDILHRKG
ncbi:MAG TPA: hypothetical protein VHM20_00635, partial [Gammaproteobacteria bacterium]|nr:hypothetical protein [Gammaproteobacteria bacterium]